MLSSSPPFSVGGNSNTATGTGTTTAGTTIQKGMTKRESLEQGMEEDLDPRIQVELEKLNSATDEINKLEKELDEANGQFRHLLSQQGSELEKLIRKLGPSIDRARPFYDAKSAADELHKKCLEAAAQFHRATDIHRAARETVTAVEHRYEKDVNFDSTWQEVLNHATIQVMDAEKQKSDSATCHRALAEQFYEAEKKVYELRKLLEKDILKSKPYFDMKNRLNGALSEVKTRTVKLQSGISAAKRAYSLALSNLEMISEEIHRKRTPGVGAENSCQSPKSQHQNILKRNPEEREQQQQQQLDNHNEHQKQKQQLNNNHKGQRGKDQERKVETTATVEHQFLLQGGNNGNKVNGYGESSESTEGDEDEEETVRGGGDGRGDGASSSSSGQISGAE